MPELPEVEVVRSALESHLQDAHVARVQIRRRDVITGNRSTKALLSGQRMCAFMRRGKQLAITADSGRAICIHLGMSGQLLVSEAPSANRAKEVPNHTHVAWSIAAPNGSRLNLLFRDSRRFGGIWTFPSVDALLARWNTLGPDALTIQAGALAHELGHSRAPIKARLLDQSVLSGVGNIYADEALFLSNIRPDRPANSISRAEVRVLATSIRKVLTRSIRAGGSTLRDYRQADGSPGEYQNGRLVYGRAGQPCPSCATPLLRNIVAQRSTVWCAACQV